MLPKIHGDIFFTNTRTMYLVAHLTYCSFQNIFHISPLIPYCHHGRFLAYLIQSRSIEHVLLSETTEAYLLLPYLRVHSPKTVYIDYVHSEIPSWHHSSA